MAENIILWARCPRRDIYLPIRIFSPDALKAEGWGDDYAFSFTGHSGQLIVDPSGNEDTIPQSAKPEHDTNLETGGNPDRTSRTSCENVTVFFATGQSVNDEGKAKCLSQH